MPTPAGYTRIQIVLHWVIFVLIAFQLVFGENIAHAYREIMRGNEVAPSFMVASHVFVGIAILVLVVLRFVIKVRRGAPALPENEPPMLKLAASLTHLALYALMFLLPISGLAAWFGGQRWAGEVHEIMKPITILLVLLHVAGALYQHFVLKSDVLNRMRKPVA